MVVGNARLLLVYRISALNEISEGRFIDQEVGVKPIPFVWIAEGKSDHRVELILFWNFALNQNDFQCRSMQMHAGYVNNQCWSRSCKQEVESWMQECPGDTLKSLSILSSPWLTKEWVKWADNFMQNDPPKKVRSPPGISLSTTARTGHRLNRLMWQQQGGGKFRPITNGMIVLNAALPASNLP